MQYVAIPSGSVVIDLNEYQKLKSAADTLANIEAEERQKLHFAERYGEENPVEVILVTKDGLRANRRFLKNPPRIFVLPCKTNADTRSCAVGGGHDLNQASNVRRYELAGFESAVGKFIYHEI